VSIGKTILLSIAITTSLTPILGTIAGPGFGRRASTVRVAVWPPELEIQIGQQFEVFAAALLDDGLVTCNPPFPFVWSSSDTSIATVTPTGRTVGENEPGCLAAKHMLQDTIARIIRFKWPRQQGMEEYNIVVTSASTFLAGLDTILADTFLVWTAGAPDSAYWVKGAARYRGNQASFGDSVQFTFPTPVVILPLGPIVVDTIP